MYITGIYHTVLLLALPFITVLSQIFYMSVYFKSMICLLSFWLFFFWRITFQFSLLSNLPVHVIITLWVFFLLTNVLTFQFLSYQFSQNITLLPYLTCTFLFLMTKWSHSSFYPTYFTCTWHSYLFLAFLFLLTHVVTIQLLPALDLFTQEVLFLAATFTTDWHLFLTYPNVGTFPRMAHSTTWMATRHLQS